VELWLTVTSLHKAPLLLAVSVVMLLASCTAEQQPESIKPDESANMGKLGTVNFSTSARSEKAQAHFLRGVAALHSFWYPVALAEFRESTNIEPDFMMGYWGEAMAHNHPIWGDPQETDAARKVLVRIKDTSKVTQRERAWLNAVKVLYGEGDKPARDRAYSAAMEKIYRDYPGDPEVAIFYALSLMGTVNPEDPSGLPTRLRAGEIASEVYRKNPNHPGAAHYVIHAYDDPENATKALDAARRYAEIAPEAPHALHMPSHIFLQLGMWPEAARSNEASWAASDKWVKQRDLSIAERDYHSLQWLQYIYLQQGRYGEAEKLLAMMRQSLFNLPKGDPRDLMFAMFTHAQMAATYVVETEAWDFAEQLVTPPRARAADSGYQVGESSNPAQAYLLLTRIPAIFARGLSAAAKGSPDAQKGIAELKAIREQSASAKEPLIAQMAKVAEIQELEIGAMFNAAKGNFDEAIRTMRKAVALEAAMPPPAGPPPVIKPANELFSDILLRADQPRNAAAQFAASLRRHANRARSLLGAARAAEQSGDKQGAASAYVRFSQQWQHGDADLKERREALDYSTQNAAH
jgi:tetratricopeptide (TPR) repeat protein